MMVWSRELEITAGTTETPELREEGSKAARPPPVPWGRWLKEYGQTPRFLQTVLYPEISTSLSVQNTSWLFLPLQIKWAYRVVRQHSFARDNSHQKGQGSSLYPQEDHNYCPPYTAILVKAKLYSRSQIKLYSGQFYAMIANLFREEGSLK